MVAQTHIKRWLGSGIYTIAEAALYARVSPQMMSRWLFGNQQGEAVLRPQFGPDERCVSFLDLVQTLAIRETRIQKRVPLPKFRQAIALAKQRFNLDYPFARPHCTYLLGDELVIAPPGEGYVEASGKHKGQRLFSFVELYLEDLRFSSDGLANIFQIYKLDNVQVLMKPQIRFGEPMLPSGYSARSIWDSVRAEGGIERAASVYGIAKEEVQTAYKFFVDHLGKTAA